MCHYIQYMELSVQPLGLLHCNSVCKCIMSIDRCVAEQVPRNNGRMRKVDLHVKLMCLLKVLIHSNT